MKRLITIAALAAATLMNAACITVIDADSDDLAWHGEDAQPFDHARDACRASTEGGSRSSAFIACMADKGWTRG
jgi:hypothetical protein